jgi:hypothetical protein
MRCLPYLRALALAAITLALLAALGSIPHINAAAFPLLPGILLAALIFPTGIHSDYGFAYMILAGILDVMVFSLLWFVGLRWRDKRRREHFGKE